MELGSWTPKPSYFERMAIMLPAGYSGVALDSCVLFSSLTQMLDYWLEQVTTLCNLSVIVLFSAVWSRYWQSRKQPTEGQSSSVNSELPDDWTEPRARPTMAVTKAAPGMQQPAVTRATWNPHLSHANSFTTIKIVMWRNGATVGALLINECSLCVLLVTYSMAVT
jgi:hypothetical protein